MERTQIIETLIDRNWSSRRKFAEFIGIPPTTLQSILKRGVGNASIDNVIKVCKGLGITIDELERMAATTDFVAESNSPYEVKDLLEDSSYDFYPVSVAAGLPLQVDGISDKEIEKITIPDYIMGKWAGNKEIFMMKVNGDSMNKVFSSGTIIAVKQTEIESLKDDDIVVFSDEHEYSVKRYFNDIENKRFIFRPDSNDRSFTDYIVPYENAKNLKIHGKVVIYIVELD